MSKMIFINEQLGENILHVVTISEPVLTNENFSIYFGVFFHESFNNHKSRITFIL